MPDGGRVYDKNTEISHYKEVLDHYETKTRQVSEQVYDGEDYYTTYKDNGDGTFTEETHSTPRYRTEWRTETYKEPVYREEPVYATKYYYEIEKWVVDRTKKSKGADTKPYWPKYQLADNERKGDTRASYILRIKTEKDTYNVKLPQKIWEQYKAGDEVEVQMIGNDITQVGDYEIKE